MSKETSSPEVNKTITVTFETAAQSVILKTKVVPEMAFIYKSMADLANLIKFVGSRPVINEDLSLQFRKSIIKDNSVIFRNAFGEVTKILSFEQAANIYDIAAQSEFKPEHANKVQAKEIKARTKK